MKYARRQHCEEDGMESYFHSKIIGILDTEHSHLQNNSFEYQPPKENSSILDNAIEK